MPTLGEPDLGERSSQREQGKLWKNKGSAHKGVQGTLSETRGVCSQVAAFENATCCLLDWTFKRQRSLLRSE